MPTSPRKADYSRFLIELSSLIDQSRGTVVRAVNSIMTAVYWELGRRIVEFEQRGDTRAGYGEELLARLSADLTKQFGRGFSVDNLERFRLFYSMFSEGRISATPSRKLPKRSQAKPSSISATALRKYTLSDFATGFAEIVTAFPLPWSHYARLIRLRSPEAVAFYEAEALRGGWSVKQLERQIASQFYERAALSKNKATMLTRGARPIPADAVSPEEAIRDPLLLEFLGLKDEYSESDLEEALIRHLETFLLELGKDFCFVARQRRLRIGDAWYRLDLLFYHRGLRCLVLIDLKLGEFTHADAGQMHLYCTYARKHWTRPEENPPVGLILCARRDDAVARYALEGLPNKVLAREYRLALPDEKQLAQELTRTRKRLEQKASK